MYLTQRWSITTSYYRGNRLHASVLICNTMPHLSQPLHSGLEVLVLILSLTLGTCAGVQDALVFMVPAVNACALTGYAYICARQVWV